MTTPGYLLLLTAALLLLVPTGLMEATGAEHEWERELIRFSAVFLALNGLLSLSARSLEGRGFNDALITRASAVALIAAAGYASLGKAFYLLVAFSLLVGITLNRSMKRMELAFERAQHRLGWKTNPPQ